MQLATHTQRTISLQIQPLAHTPRFLCLFNRRFSSPAGKTRPPASHPLVSKPSKTGHRIGPRYYSQSRMPSSAATTSSPSTHRSFHNTTFQSAVSSPRPRGNLRNRDRGPASKEDTQTDFGALNVLGGTAVPSTSVDICTYDGFTLDSGLRVGEGNGVILTDGEAFVWRPWMGFAPKDRGGTEVVDGTSLTRMGKNKSEKTGGVLNSSGQFEVPDEAWGVLGLLWPKPDLLIVGTGSSIRPLALQTRAYLESLGVRIEVLDSRNAASQFNLLAMERGIQEVAAAILPVGFGTGL